MPSYGSNAYKLQPAAAPLTKTAPNKKPRVKEKKKTIKYQLIAVVVIVFLVQLLLCSRWVALYDLHSELESRTAVLEDLQRENEQKALAIDSMVDASKVEEYAKNELGMKKIESNQIVYIQPVHGDSMQKVAKSNSNSSKRGIIGALSSSFSGLLEYLK
jgi:cell division protein FtsL